MSDDTEYTDDDETYSAIRTVLGTTERTARWHLTDEVDILTALGRSRFDLRLVETTGREVAEISVKCFLGTVSLVVPPGTLVVLDGTSFLAGASCEVEPGDRSDLPRIEVTATTILGRVKIVSREPDSKTEPVAESGEPDEAVVEATPEPNPVEAEVVEADPVGAEVVEADPIEADPIEVDPVEVETPVAS